jgi:hypothetical protein
MSVQPSGIGPEARAGKCVPILILEHCACGMNRRRAMRDRTEPHLPSTVVSGIGHRRAARRDTEGVMRPALWEPAFERITKGLHQAHDALLTEQLPERWIELISRLNALEDCDRSERKIDQASPPARLNGYR